MIHEGLWEVSPILYLSPISLIIYDCERCRSFHIGSVRGSPNGTIGNFTNGTIGSQWYHWLTNCTNCAIGRAKGTIVITIDTNGITNGTIGKTLNDIGIPLVPLANPERMHFNFSIF